MRLPVQSSAPARSTSLVESRRNLFSNNQGKESSKTARKSVIKQNSAPSLQALLQRDNSKLAPSDLSLSRESRRPTQSGGKAATFVMSKAKSASNVFLNNRDSTVSSMRAASRKSWTPSRSTVQPTAAFQTKKLSSMNRAKSSSHIYQGSNENSQQSRVTAAKRSWGAQSQGAYTQQNSFQPSMCRAKSASNVFLSQNIPQGKVTSKQSNTSLPSRTVLEAAGKFGSTVGRPSLTRKHHSARTFSNHSSRSYGHEKPTNEITIPGQEEKALDLSALFKDRKAARDNDGSCTTLTSIMTDNLSSSSLWSLSEESESEDCTLETEESEFVKKGRSMKENRAARTIQSFLLDATVILVSHKQRMVELDAKLQSIRQQKQVELAQVKETIQVEKDRFRLELEHEMEAQDEAMQGTKDKNLRLVEECRHKVEVERKERDHLQAELNLQEQANRNLERETMVITSKCKHLKSSFKLTEQQMEPWRDLDQRIKSVIPEMEAKIERVNENGAKCKSQCGAIGHFILNIIDIIKKRVASGHVEAGQAVALEIIEARERTCQSTVEALVGTQWLGEALENQKVVRPMSSRKPRDSKPGTVISKSVSSQHLDIDREEWKEIKRDIKRRRSRRSLLKRQSEGAASA